MSQFLTAYKQNAHIVPTDREYLGSAFTGYFHELIPLPETFFIKAARTAVIAVKAYRLTVFRHHDIYLTRLDSRSICWRMTDKALACLQRRT